LPVVTLQAIAANEGVHAQNQQQMSAMKIFRQLTSNERKRPRKVSWPEHFRIVSIAHCDHCTVKESVLLVHEQ